MLNIQVAKTDGQIMFCFPVIHELRPLLKEEEFLNKVRRMQEEGFMLAYIEADKKAVAAAGFRMNELFYRGKSVYIDDLVTLPDYRSKNYGGQLIDWIIQYAKDNNCKQVHLDSGVQRFDAHRFYLRKKFVISSHHFQLDI
ncbi:MAG TPA: GNAT family N-acetyltransferase [Bacteroidia bacterium]|nr:GNAT family N-acetyltransferase [Bacteroidia bacterium]